MATKALAIKYRPSTWEDVVEQTSTKIILQQQLNSGEIKHAYLFCGSAGTGKTTCARIFAHDINSGQGHPIEMDAASNSGVDDVRNIIQQAKTKSLDSEYKVFIIDECHSISNTGWQAFLKLIEEPPVKSIFIFCTTDPQKIPKTILSRVQRYDFQRISQQGIVRRLFAILAAENRSKEPNERARIDEESIEYIAKIADGGMRDAISLMDKCLAYSTDLTLENVVAALGTTDYDTMFKLTDYLLQLNGEESTKLALQLIDDMYHSGKDLKQFVPQYLRFLLDISKWGLGCDWKYLQLPRLPEYEKWLKDCDDNIFFAIDSILSTFINLQSDIKWSQSIKYDIETRILLECNSYGE
ncbi:DNA polymerase III subunit gamma/tau [bacterium]|nr:DNA polymerase III subunit gamma/tau [bacterium]